MIYNIKEKSGTKIGDFNWKTDALKDFFIITKRKDPYLEGMYNHAVEQVSELFNVNKSKIKDNLKLYVWKSRKTYDTLSGRKSKSWEIARGFDRNLGLFLLDKDYYDKESSHKYDPNQFFPLIKHEVIHSFESYLTKNKFKPLWLMEGISICFSGQNQFLNVPKKFSHFLDSFSEYKDANAIYNQSGFAVMILYQKFGKTKLFELLKNISQVNSKKDFNSVFKKIYGENLTYRLFNKLLEEKK